MADFLDVTRRKTSETEEELGEKKAKEKEEEEEENVKRKIAVTRRSL